MAWSGPNLPENNVDPLIGERREDASCNKHFDGSEHARSDVATSTSLPRRDVDQVANSASAWISGGKCRVTSIEGSMCTSFGGPPPDTCM